MATDKLKAIQKAHESKIKKQATPTKAMMGVCKGHDMAEEKGEKKGGK